MPTDFSKTRDYFHLAENEIILNAHATGIPASAEYLNQSSQLPDGTLIDEIRQRIGALIGVPPDSIHLTARFAEAMFDTLRTALAARVDRNVVLTGAGTLPARYRTASEFATRLPKGAVFKSPAPDVVEDRIASDIAVLCLNHISHFTGRLQNMARLNEKCRRAGALTLWDVTNSAGILPIDLSGTETDFAVGRFTGFLSGGKSQGGFICLPSEQVGTGADTKTDLSHQPLPSRSELVELHAGLSVWDIAKPADVARRARQLTTLLSDLLEVHCPQLKRVSPADAGQRGAMLCFQHGNAERIQSSLRSRRVRTTVMGHEQMIQFSLSPLCQDDMDVGRAFAAIESVLSGQPPLS